ncbi:MAG: hypothetical protein RL033_2254, partial [Pseudomonadota bacterium]
MKGGVICALLCCAACGGDRALPQLGPIAPE